MKSVCWIVSVIFSKRDLNRDIKGVENREVEAPNRINLIMNFLVC